MATHGESETDPPVPSTSPTTVESVNSRRLEFHASLADGQWFALSKALDAAPGPCTPCDPIVIRAEVKRFLKLHLTKPGSGPFLLGFRALIEAQSGRQVAVAWRIDPALLTQSGGEGWMRDAVTMLSTACVRRRDLETMLINDQDNVNSNDSNHEKETPGGVQNKYLAWQLPMDLGDLDLYKLLMKLPDRKTLIRASPSGEIVANASLPEHPTRVTETIGFGGNDCTPSLGKRRHVCCMIFVVTTVCVVAMMTR